jgi:hypothetical protein
MGQLEERDDDRLFNRATFVPYLLPIERNVVVVVVVVVSSLLLSGASWCEDSAS